MKRAGKMATIAAAIFAPAMVAALTLIAACPVRAQGSRKDDVVFNAQGRPMAGATVRVCTSSATGQPCSPLANVYSDAALTQALANPLTADGLGNYTFYAAAGRYEIEISGPGIVTKQLPNVILPNDPSAPTFTSVTTTSGISAFSLSLSGNLTVNGSAAVTGAFTVGGNPVPTTSQANTWTAPQAIASSLAVKGPEPWWRDVTQFGAFPHTVPGGAAFTTGSINSGSRTLTVASALDFATNNGIFISDTGPTVTLSAPTISAIKCFGPVQTLVTGVVNNCGSTTYTYEVAAVDRYGGYSAGSAPVAFTAGIAALTPDNYNWGMGGMVSGEEAIYIWKKIGAGSWSCLEQSSTANEVGENQWYFEDYGQAGTCPPWIPSTPPSSAGRDPLITTISAISGTTITLAGAASATVSGRYVFPDESVAVAAAIVAANNDSASSPIGAGGPCVLIPAGGVYFISNLSFHDILGGGPEDGICVSVSGSLYLYNMGIRLDAVNEDIAGMGNSGSANSNSEVLAAYGGAPFIVSGSSSARVHGFFIRTNVDGFVTTGGASNFHFWDNDINEGNQYAPYRIGSNSIFGEIDHSFINAYPGTGEASIVFDCQDGGTTNTISVHDNSFHNHTFKFQGQQNGGGGGNQCDVAQLVDYGNVAESQVADEFGWYNIDGGFDSSYGDTISQNSSTLGDTNADPFSGSPSAVYELQTGGRATSGLNFSSDNFPGPWYSNSIIRNNRPELYGGAPCNRMTGWIIQDANNPGAVAGKNMGCDTGGYAHFGQFGFETDATFYGSENYSGAFGIPNFLQVMQRPMWASLTTTTGGSFAAGTYYYELAGCMTSSNTANCTNVSYEKNVTTAINGKNLGSIVLSYQSRFDHCQLWRGASPGGEDHYQTFACTGTGPYSFTDTGSAGTAGTPPVKNTAAYTDLDTGDNLPSYINSGPGGDPNHAVLIGPLPAAARTGAKVDVSGGTLSAEAGFTTCLATKSATYSLTAPDCWVNVTGTTTITVPHAIVGQRWVVFNSGSATVTVQADSGNINGGANITLAANTGKEVTCDGSNCFAH